MAGRVEKQSKVMAAGLNRKIPRQALARAVQTLRRMLDPRRAGGGE